MLLLALFGLCGAHFAIDVSSDVGPDSLRCIKDMGYPRIIIRAYRNDNTVDSACPHTIYNARTAGMAVTDIYMFPCPHCSSPEDQVSSMLRYLLSYNISFTGQGIQLSHLWLDIEDTANHDYWGSDSRSNADWMSELYSAASNAIGAEKVGIYSSIYMWETIFADSSFDCCSHAKLWYADYDGGPSFSDFRPFAGWRTPFGKQFSGTGGLCTASVDKSYFRTE